MNHSPAFLCDIFSANSNSNKKCPWFVSLWRGPFSSPSRPATSTKNRPPLKTGHFEPQRSQPGHIFVAKIHILKTLFFKVLKVTFKDRGIKLGHGFFHHLDDIFGESTLKWKFLAQNSATRKNCFLTHESTGSIRLGRAPAASNGALHTCTWKEKNVPKNASLSNSQI